MSKGKRHMNPGKLMKTRGGIFRKPKPRKRKKK
jgi:hypothetical protein